MRERSDRMMRRPLSGPQDSDCMLRADFVRHENEKGYRVCSSREASQRLIYLRLLWCEKGTSGLLQVKQTSVVDLLMDMQEGCQHADGCCSVELALQARQLGSYGCTEDRSLPVLKAYLLGRLAFDKVSSDSVAKN